MAIDIDSCDYTVNDEGIHVTVDPLQCCACRAVIAAGHRYRHGDVGEPDDDDYELLPLCLRCSALHDHLAAIMPPGECPEWSLDCGHTYQDRWERDPPPEIAALAFMTPEEMQNEPPSR